MPRWTSSNNPARPDEPNAGDGGVGRHRSRRHAARPPGRRPAQALGGPRSRTRRVTALTAVAALVAGSSALALGGVANAAITEVPVSADGYVSAASPAKNFASSTVLRTDADPVIRSYLRFDLNDVTDTITDATLRVYANVANSTGIAVAPVTDGSWSEETLTWANAPAIGQVTTASGAISAGTWVDLDVTSLAKGGGEVDLALVSSATQATNISSRESGTNAPRLVLTTKPAPASPAGVLVSADAAVSAASPTTNFGGSKALRTDADPVIRSYLRFDLSDVTDTVTAATLHVFTNTANKTGIAVAPVSAGTWSEESLTWKNAPAVGKTTAASGPITAGSWVALDVTALTKGGGAVDFALISSDTQATNISSRETGTHAPRLTLTTKPAPTPTPTPTVTPTPPTGASDAIRAAFYYPWYPNAWKQQGFDPYTKYTPSDGRYSSADAAVVAKHIVEMQYGGMDAGIASWWGQGHHTDVKFQGLLDAAKGTGFRWSLYYEAEGKADPTSAQITSDLTYIKEKYTSDASYLRIDGKPVLFVYGGGADNCPMADRWAAADTAGFYVVLKVFPGYAKCAKQPDSWHQYAPAVATSDQGTYSYTVSPGFDEQGQPTRLVRDPARFAADVKKMAASKAKLQLVTTFNEWGEGTSVESAKEWASPSGHGVYLDILHDALGSAPGSGGSSPAPTPSPTPTSTPTPTPTPTPTTGPDPTLVAVGDIACAAGKPVTAGNCRQGFVADVVASLNPTAFAPLGDLQYDTGLPDDFAGSYDKAFGRFMGISYPAIGNHEYLTKGAPGYFGYFGDRAHGPGAYYSYNLGTWHVVVLNSNCGLAGGCDATSAQYKWLQADLKANPNTCTMAYWHHPLFSSGQHADNLGARPLWDVLAGAGAELVLNGHDHIYERFAPQLSDGTRDDARGMREFVIGTGGKNHTAIANVQPNSEVRNTDTYGVLQLTLKAGSYDWRFVPEAGKTFTDSGSANCR